MDGVFGGYNVPTNDLSFHRGRPSSTRGECGGGTGDGEGGPRFRRVGGEGEVDGVDRMETSEIHGRASAVAPGFGASVACAGIDYRRGTHGSHRSHHHRRHDREDLRRALGRTRKSRVDRASHAARPAAGGSRSVGDGTHAQGLAPPHRCRSRGDRGHGVGDRGVGRDRAARGGDRDPARHGHPRPNRRAPVSASSPRRRCPSCSPGRSVPSR